MYLWPIGISGNFEQGERRGSRRACPPLVHRLLPNGLQGESVGGRWGCRAQEWAELESQQSG